MFLEKPVRGTRNVGRGKDKVKSLELC